MICQHLMVLPSSLCCCNNVVHNCIHSVCLRDIACTIPSPSHHFRCLASVILLILLLVIIISIVFILVLIIRCLSLSQKQSLAAAWPHAMGMLSAHLFHFSRDIVGQQQQLQQRQRQPTKDSAASSAPLLLAQLFRTPQWLLKRFPPPRSNTELDFRDTSSSSSSSSSSSNSGNRRSKQKTRGTGNILGSSL